MDQFYILGKKLTKWHHSYIQNAYRELEHGITRKQLDTLDINANGKSVLDVGCGAGNLLVALSMDAPKVLVGVDVDPIFLSFGCSQFEKLIERPAPTPTLLRAALPSLPFTDETFDLITCFLVMPQVPDDKAALIELARVLKPGGTLAISGHGLGFPLRYLRRFKLKPLQMYPASLIYKCTGKKWIRNTLQNDNEMCGILNSIGVVPEIQRYSQRVLGCVATYWIKAIKRETIPKAMQ